MNQTPQTQIPLAPPAPSHQEVVDELHKRIEALEKTAKHQQSQIDNTQRSNNALERENERLKGTINATAERLAQHMVRDSGDQLLEWLPSERQAEVRRYAVSALNFRPAGE